LMLPGMPEKYYVLTLSRLSVTSTPSQYRR
jgi:hypothetical protein